MGKCNILHVSTGHTPLVVAVCLWVFPRPVARIEFGEVWGPPKVDLLDPKSGLFEPHPLNLPTKTQFLVHFVAKSGPFGMFGVVRRTPWLWACFFRLECPVETEVGNDFSKCHMATEHPLTTTS